MANAGKIAGDPPLFVGCRITRTELFRNRLRVIAFAMLLQRQKNFPEYRIPGIMFPQAENPLVCMADKFARNTKEASSKRFLEVPLSFCRLVSEKIIKNRLEALKPDRFQANLFNTFPASAILPVWIRVSVLGVCRIYASRLDFCPSLQKQASCLLLPSRLRSLSPPSVAAFLRYRSALSSVCESLDSHTPLLRCQNTHVAQLRLSFCRLASGKNHQKSPRSLKIRQTPSVVSQKHLHVIFNL